MLALRYWKATTMRERSGRAKLLDLVVLSWCADFWLDARDLSSNAGNIPDLVFFESIVPLASLLQWVTLLLLFILGYLLVLARPTPPHKTRFPKPTSRPHHVIFRDPRIMQNPGPNPAESQTSTGQNRDPRCLLVLPSKGLSRPQIKEQRRQHPFHLPQLDVCHAEDLASQRTLSRFENAPLPLFLLDQ